MFCVYILFSSKLNKFYIGSTDDVNHRVQEHNNALNKDAFTARGIPWQVFLIIPNLHSKQAFLVEAHIKKMKSKTFILNLKKYPDLILNVVSKYQ